jgi:uncharacterized protein YbjT (DUF2867 family)
MKIAITGGTGFIGRHLAHDLVARGHQVMLIARGLYTRGEQVHSNDNLTFERVDVTDTAALLQAFAGCTAVVHCAGSSIEDGFQTFQQVHVEGASSAVAAARQAGVVKFVLVSYLHARPDKRSAYHRTKWEGEEIVRRSGLNYKILKALLVYGPVDHLQNNLGKLLLILPVFAN